MKTLKDLKKGETLLTTLRKVSGGKYQIEIREFVENPNSRVNLVALLNASDERFGQVNKTRAAWMSAEAKELQSYFGIDVEALSFDENGIAEVNILNPEVAGHRLHVEIVDSLTPSYENQQPKQVNGKNGTTFFMKDGQHIYSSTRIVAGTPKHQIIESDVRETKAVITNVSASAMSLNA